MFDLQQKWIELDSLLEGVQSEMKEKQIVSNYLKSLGMKRTVPVVIQQKLQDRRLARIYVWKNSPIGNVALLTGRSIEPSLHFLVLETENHDGDEIDMAVAVSGTNYVSVPIPHTLEHRMAQNSHSVHQQSVHSQRPVHHKPKPVQHKSKPVKSKRKPRKPARHNPANASNGFIAPTTYPNYGHSSATSYMTMKESFPSVWLLTVLNKFFPEIVISSKVQLSDFQLTVVLDSPYLSKQNYKLAIEYKYIVKKGWMDLNIHLQDKATSTVIYTWGVELLADDASQPTTQPEYANAIHSKLMPFIGKEIQTYISNPSGYVHPTDFAKVNLSNVRPRQMKNHTQPRPVVDENNQPIEDFESGDNNAREQNREIIEQTVETVRSRTSTEPTFDEIDEPQDQSDQVRIKYDFEGLQEEPIIPITDDLLFTLDDFSDVKWTTKIDYKNLWWIFAKNMTLQPICERLNKLFVPKVEDIGKAIVSSEWCVKQVNSTLKAGKQEKVEMIFGLSANYTIQKTKLYGSVIKKTKPISEPQTIELAFGITSQSNGLRLRVGKCTDGKSLNGFTPQKAYRLTMPYKQFKGMHLTDVMVGFFNMVLIHILSNPNILAKIGEYCELPTRQTFTGVTKTVIQPTVDRSTVVPRPTTQSVRDTLSSVMPQIEFINSLDQVSTEPSLNRWYAGSLAYDFPTTGNYFEIVLFAHLMADNKLKLTIQVNSGAGFNFSQNDDYFALLAKVEQTPQGTYLTQKTWEIAEGWYNFLHNALNDAGLSFSSKVNSELQPQFIIHLGQQTTKRVAQPVYNDFYVEPTPNGLVISPKGTINQIFLDLETDTSWLSDLFNAMKTGLYFKKGDLEWVDGYVFKQTNDDGSIVTVGVDVQDATVLNDLIGNINVLSQNYPKQQTTQEPSLIEGVTANQDALNLPYEQRSQLQKFIVQTFAEDFPQWNADVLLYSNDRVEIYLSDISLIKPKYNFKVLINKTGLHIFGYTSPYFDANSVFKIDTIPNQVSVLTIKDLLTRMMLGSKQIKQWIASNGSALPATQLEYFGSSQTFAKHLRNNPYSSAIAMQIDETLKTLSVVLVTITGHKQKAPKLFIKPVAYRQMYDPTKMNFTNVSWDKKILQDHSDLVDNSFLPMAYFQSGGLGYQKLHYNEIKTISDYLIALFEEGVVSWTQSISTLPIALNSMVAELGNQSIANSIAEIKGMVTMTESLAPFPIDHLKIAYEYSIDQNAQEPRIQTPKIQLADAMDWAVKRGVFNFENHSTFKAPAQDKELMDLYTMVVNEYGSSAGQDLFDAYTASWNKAHKDFTDAQIAQQQAQQAQATVEPPQGSTGSLGTQISTIDDVLQYPDGTLFVTPNQNNDYEIRVFAKVGDELFGFDEDGSALTLDFDELEDLGDLFYQSIQVSPFRIQQVYFDQSESKQMVADALQAIGM